MIALFSVTIFLSAFLLFSVQPMVGKMVLPIYGGVPSIWNVCMFFFQLTLLAGYSYAHFSIKHFRFRLQAIILMIMFFISLLLLPFIIDEYAEASESLSPAIELLGRLVLSMGFPLFVISSLSPLLQRWFSLSHHRFSADPYFLYASSNIGSMTALFFYPFVLERYLTTNEQSSFWTSGFGLLGIMVMVCGFVVWKANAPKQNMDKQPRISNHVAVNWKKRLLWLFAAFVPSSLMLGVTTYITTDLAAIPLLWVFPLALYLLTFVFAFAQKNVISQQFVIRLIPFILIPLAPTFFFLSKFGLVMIPLHLLMFFLVALGCHGELAKSRPPIENLTEFYLFISIGGALGGLFNSLIYPIVFNEILEYPLTMFFACLVISFFSKNYSQGRAWVNVSDVLLPAVLFFISLALIRGSVLLGMETDLHFLLLFIIVYAPTALITFGAKDRAYRFSFCFAALLLSIGILSNMTQGEHTYISRNFYGVKKVVIDTKQELRSLVHGNTVHGMQFISGPSVNEPLAYYHRSGPIGDVFRIHRKEKPFSDIAVVGLGIGSIASYMETGETVTFYEIDPEIIELANNHNFFSFLLNTKGSYSIVLGDARLKLRNAKDGGYDMIILDAFSSDSIPIHLLTREAFELYLSKIKSNGLLVFHISNRYVNLKSVVAQHAKESELISICKFDDDGDKNFSGKAPSEYAVVGKPESIIKLLLQDRTWRMIEPGRDVKTWTDKYSTIIAHLKI